MITLAFTRKKVKKAKKVTLPTFIDHISKINEYETCSKYHYAVSFANVFVQVELIFITCKPRAFLQQKIIFF